MRSRLPGTVRASVCAVETGTVRSRAPWKKLTARRISLGSNGQGWKSKARSWATPRAQLAERLGVVGSNEAAERSVEHLPVGFGQLPACYAQELARPPAC